MCTNVPKGLSSMQTQMPKSIPPRTAFGKINIFDIIITTLNIIKINKMGIDLFIRSPEFRLHRASVIVRREPLLGNVNVNHVS